MVTADGNCCSALNDYYRAFSAYDTHRALSYYNVPVVFTTAEGVTAATTSESATRLAKDATIPRLLSGWIDTAPLRHLRLS